MAHLLSSKSFFSMSLKMLCLTELKKLQVDIDSTHLPYDLKEFYRNTVINGICFGSYYLHTENTKGSYQCNICPSKFDTYRKYLDHHDSLLYVLW